MGKEAEAVARKFASGSMLLQGDRVPLLPAGLVMVDDVTAEVALSEGRYHQVCSVIKCEGRAVLLAAMWLVLWWSWCCVHATVF